MTVEFALPLLMFASLFLFLLSGFPVAFVLAGTGLFFSIIGSFLGHFELSDFGFLPPRIYGVMNSFTLVAVPLFILMGITLEKSGLAEDLLNTMESLFKKLPGGLTISLILVGAILAASTGIVGATVVTMGVISLPTLLSRGYDKKISCGTIAASGTLGQIIPPSIVLVLLGDLMNVAVADLFAGALVPGLLLVCFYIIYVFLRAFLDPSLAPKVPDTDEPFIKLLLRSLVTLIAPLLLMLIVLGSILFGVAAPTEAAACGAFGALVIALFRRKLTWNVLVLSLERTTFITSMVFTLLIGAQVFTVVFRGLGGDHVISEIITELSLGKFGTLLAVMILVFILGCFLDFIEICFIVVPIVVPILVGLHGLNPLWVAILLAINLQTSFLTPPFGFALFYLRGVAPPEVSTKDIYLGVIPFILIQAVVLVLVWTFPDIATFLPNYLFR